MLLVLLLQLLCNPNECEDGRYEPQHVDLQKSWGTPKNFDVLQLLRATGTEGRGLTSQSAAMACGRIEGSYDECGYPAAR